MRTIWVFGDQLNRRIGAMADADPGRDRILLVESEAALGRGAHVQRNHLVITAMRRFGAELGAAGFEVDRRRAPSLPAGFEAHVAEHRPDSVVATEPNSRAARALCDRLGVDQTRSDQFLCHPDDFAGWAATRTGRLRLEDFYRWHRTRLGYLMDGDEPVGGRWNLDSDNREPPPRDVGRFPAPVASRLDDVDEEVIASLPPTHGAEPVGLWPTSRRAAQARLRHFVEEALPDFGPFEDAVSGRSWHLAHSLLSPALNLGLLLPGEVCDAVVERFEAGGVPLSSAEGFVRQVVGWREYVWGLYWLWPDHGTTNELGHRRAVPPALTGEADTRMRCVADTVAGLHERAWVHHIPRLMILSNLANLYGVDPRRVTTWMSRQYIDAAEWVMVPNVHGMAMWADGGRMATKPYVSAGAYLNRMTDHCRECAYDPRDRVGERACPFTTLYWDFMAEHRDRLAESGRMARPLANLDRLGDLDEVRRRAVDVRRGLRDGTI